MRKLKAIQSTEHLIKAGHYYQVLDYNNKRGERGKVTMMLGTDYKHTFYGLLPDNSFDIYFGYKSIIMNLNKNIKIL